jgi:WhiB family redox-sensing transcriptional regulator
MGNRAPTSPVPYVEDWRHRAPCRDEDPEIFFGEAGPASTAAARAVCASCPVRRPCLTEGIREPHGVRAGLTEAERDPFGRAYAVYRELVAAAHDALAQVAAGDPGLREALAAVEAEADAVGSLALTVAAGGADEAELRDLAAQALDARQATAAALGELYLRPLDGMDRAVTRLMAAAARAAAVHTTLAVAPAAVSVPVFGAVA